MIIVVAGATGRFPGGGQAWSDLQYLFGFRELGHEVFYLEDAGEGSWVYDREAEQVTTDRAYPAEHIRYRLKDGGLGSRWAYRAGEKSIGMWFVEVTELLARTDPLVINAAPLPVWRAEFDRPRRRVFIDGDPGFTYINRERIRAPAQHDRTLRPAFLGRTAPSGCRR